jgi:hypothetical protein
MVKDMARVFATSIRAMSTAPTEKLEQAFVEGALFALQEAADALLRDDHPAGGRSHRKDRVYAAWLRERAIHIGDD